MRCRPPYYHPRCHRVARPCYGSAHAAAIPLLSSGFSAASSVNEKTVASRSFASCRHLLPSSRCGHLFSTSATRAALQSLVQWGLSSSPLDGPQACCSGRRLRAFFTSDLGQVGGARAPVRAKRRSMEASTRMAGLPTGCNCTILMTFHRVCSVSSAIRCPSRSSVNQSQRASES